jgi:hypothetical protein
LNRVSASVSFAIRSSTHSWWKTRSGWSSRVMASGISRAGVAIIAPTPKPAQSTPGPTGPTAMRCIIVAPLAASSASASRPRPRSISTTVVASVFDPAAFAVSAMRTTSPPMLLGRKLLKKVATRNERVSVANDSATRCAWSSSPQRHALASTMTR